MTAKIGIRELSRNANILDRYDYVEVEDKKTHQYKGLFVSPEYADEVKNFLEQKLSSQTQEKLDELMQFAGIADGDSENASFQELQASKSKKYD